MGRFFESVSLRGLQIRGDRSGYIKRGGTEDRALERAPSIPLHSCPHACCLFPPPRLQRGCAGVLPVGCGCGVGLLWQGPGRVDRRVHLATPRDTRLGLLRRQERRDGVSSLKGFHSLHIIGSSLKAIRGCFPSTFVATDDILGNHVGCGHGCACELRCGNSPSVMVSCRLMHWSQIRRSGPIVRGALAPAGGSTAPSPKATIAAPCTDRIRG